MLRSICAATMMSISVICLGADQSPLTFAPDQVIDVDRFNDQTITENYTRGYGVNTKGRMYIEQGDVPASLSYIMDAGQPQKYGKKNYIAVRSEMAISLPDQETVSVTMTDLYDPKTLRLEYGISDDGSVTAYTHMNDAPKTMKVGEAVLLSISRDYEPGKKKAKASQDNKNLLELYSSKNLPGAYELCDTTIAYKPKTDFTQEVSRGAFCKLITETGAMGGYVVFIPGYFAGVFLTDVASKK